MGTTNEPRALGRIAVALIVTIALGCGESTTPPAPEPLVVTPPAIAWLAANTPPVVAPNIPWMAGRTPIARSCAARWTPIADRCQPWAADVPTCSGAMMRVPGEPACRPLSPSCPSSDFAADLPAGALYVLAGAPLGGDGSLALPFATLAEALTAAGPGATIALSRGTHAISGTIDLGASLRGACAAETILSATGGARLSIATALRIEDLSLRAGDVNDPIFVDGPHAVSIDRVLVDGGFGGGITAARGAAITLADVRVASIGARLGPTTHSGGLVAREGGTIEGARVVVDEATWIGASAGAGSRVALVDSVLRGTRETADYPQSAGATCWGSGTLTLTRCLLESNISRGVEILGGCTSATLEDVVVRDTRAGTDGESYGLISQGALIARGLGLFDTNYCAVAALGEARLEISDVVVDGVASRGLGLAASSGGTITVQRGVVRNVRDALFTWDSGAIDAEDVQLERISGNAARVELSTIAVRRAHAYDIATGFLAGGPSSSIVATDVIFERIGSPTQPDSDALTARGGGQISAEHIVVRDAAGAAVGAYGAGSSATISDWSCSGGGVSVFAIGGGTAEITRAAIDAPGTHGVVASGAGTRVAMTDVRVHDVAPESTEDGYALGVADGAELVLDSVVVERVGTALSLGTTGLEQPVPRVFCTDVIFRGSVEAAVDLQAAAATFLRLRIDGAGSAGIVARTAAVDLTITDVAIAELTGRSSDGARGRGIDATGGAVIRGSRLTISNAREVGLSATDLGTRVTLDDVWINGTREEACADACPAPTTGHGVVSVFEAIVTLNNFRVSSSRWAGVLVANEGRLVLTGGLIDGNRVGRALLGTPPLAFSSHDVAYERNEILEANADVVIPPSSAF